MDQSFIGISKIEIKIYFDIILGNNKIYIIMSIFKNILNFFPS